MPHPPHRPHMLSGWLVSFCRLVLAAIVLSAQCGCAGRPGNSTSGDTVLDTAPVEKALGIEVQSLRLSAGGYMIDFRYRAVDPGKAIVLFDRETRPYLVHEATNAKFLIPAPAKVGPLRQTTNNPVAGKTYFMMFANPGQYVKAGDRVTIVFGNYRIEHLQVE